MEPENSTGLEKRPGRPDPVNISGEKEHIVQFSGVAVMDWMRSVE
jgi:hypothetical protein